MCARDAAADCFACWFFKKYKKQQPKSEYMLMRACVHTVGTWFAVPARICDNSNVFSLLFHRCRVRTYIPIHILFVVVVFDFQLLTLLQCILPVISGYTSSSSSSHLLCASLYVRKRVRFKCLWSELQPANQPASIWLWDIIKIYVLFVYFRVKTTFSVSFYYQILEVVVFFLLVERIQKNFPKRENIATQTNVCVCRDEEF